MEIFTVDAFTDSPFSGNPAAVCVIKTDQLPLEESLMQQIAAEMNLSETAFVKSDTHDDEATSSTFTLKWFTPICEVNLCGHATLATAAVLFDTIHNPNTVLSFSTLSGILKATHNKDDHTISLDFPLSPYEVQDMAEHHDLIKNTITSPHLNVVDCQYSAVTKKLLVRLADDITRSQLETLTPNTQSLLAVEQSKVKGIIVTVKAEEEKYDFYSRYFAPWVGIPEDPVTGSAHTVLGPYWSKVLNKKTLRARQCSPRGGDLSVTVKEEDGRVTLTGRACIVLKGKLTI